MSPPWIRRARVIRTLGQPRASTSVRNWSHDSSALCDPSSTRAPQPGRPAGCRSTSGPCRAATVTASARLARISPTGASLKNALELRRPRERRARRPGSGTCPWPRTPWPAAPGAVSQAASLGGLLDVARPGPGRSGRSRPSCRRRRGTTSAKSQPLTPSELPSTTPSIQPGQAMVAKPSFWKDAVQSSLHWARRVDSPVVDVAGDGLPDRLHLRVVDGDGRCRRSSKGFSTWLSIAWASPPEESYQAVSGTSATNSSPRAK